MIPNKVWFQKSTDEQHLSDKYTQSKRALEINIICFHITFMIYVKINMLLYTYIRVHSTNANFLRTTVSHKPQSKGARRKVHNSKYPLSLLKLHAWLWQICLTRTQLLACAQWDWWMNGLFLSCRTHSSSKSEDKVYYEAL